MMLALPFVPALILLLARLACARIHTVHFHREPPKVANLNGPCSTFLKIDDATASSLDALVQARDEVASRLGLSVQPRASDGGRMARLAASRSDEGLLSGSAMSMAGGFGDGAAGSAASPAPIDFRVREADGDDWISVRSVAQLFETARRGEVVGVFETGGKENSETGKQDEKGGGEKNESSCKQDEGDENCVIKSPKATL
eukprot:TRINITY_DN15320_c0_g2_i1.p1 TRINITY_DN15320_c0_g2~~TRINITY_DN15320_c0_g2_i1.p1  ORF type:complete len:201 (+),score=26.03 TRINITY_DN15320_c0_g2_i1:183-785(+)